MSQSREYNTSVTFIKPPRNTRRYFFIHVDDGSVSLRFGGGQGALPLNRGGLYASDSGVNTEIEITVNESATYTVLTDNFEMES